MLSVMGNCLFWKCDMERKIEELEISLADSERELMNMAAQLKKIEAQNLALAKDGASLRVKNRELVTYSLHVRDSHLRRLLA